MSIKEWAKLSCDCGSFQFTPTFDLYWKEGQGTTAKPTGYLCAKCGKVTNTASLTNKAKDASLQKKIDELRAEQETQVPAASNDIGARAPWIR